MITVSDLGLAYSGQPLFSHVDLQFTKGNCYGIIGANGAGKSTFLKILSGELEPTSGEVSILPKTRMSVLKQDQNAYNEYNVMDTVIMGNQRLYDIGKEKDALYEKEEMTEEDGIRACELEEEFAELGGWEAESDASRAVRLTPAELEDVLRPAMEYAAANGMEINFTSPRLAARGDAAHAGPLPKSPAAAPVCPTWPWRRTARCCPCQSWLTGKDWAICCAPPGRASGTAVPAAPSAARAPNWSAAASWGPHRCRRAADEMELSAPVGAFGARSDLRYAAGPARHGRGAEHEIFHGQCA